MSATFKDAARHGYERRKKEYKLGNRCGATGKVRFDSWESAVKRGTENFDNDFRSYKCKFCSGFHLTSRTWMP